MPLPSALRRVGAAAPCSCPASGTAPSSISQLCSGSAAAARAPVPGCWPGLYSLAVSACTVPATAKAGKPPGWLNQRHPPKHLEHCGCLAGAAQGARHCRVPCANQGAEVGMKLTVCPAAPTLGSKACPGGFRDVVVSAAQCQHHGSEHKGFTPGQGAVAPVLQPQTQAANIWLPAVSHLGGCRWLSPSSQPSTPGTGLPMGIRGAQGRRNPGISAAGANIISWCPQQGQCIPSSCVGSAAPPGAPQSSHHGVTPSPCLWGAVLHSCVSQQITAYSLFFFHFNSPLP